MTKPIHGGRPVKITAKVSVLEHTALEQAAWVANCTLSEVIRRALLAYIKPGGAAWVRKTDLGVTAHRPGRRAEQTE